MIFHTSGLSLDSSSHEFSYDDCEIPFLDITPPDQLAWQYGTDNEENQSLSNDAPIIKDEFTVERIFRWDCKLYFLLAEAKMDPIEKGLYVYTMSQIMRAFDDYVFFNRLNEKDRSIVVCNAKLQTVLGLSSFKRNHLPEIISKFATPDPSYHKYGAVDHTAGSAFEVKPINNSMALFWVAPKFRYLLNSMAIEEGVVFHYHQITRLLSKYMARHQDQLFKKDKNTCVCNEDLKAIFNVDEFHYDEIHEILVRQIRCFKIYYFKFAHIDQVVRFNVPTVL